MNSDLESELVLSFAPDQTSSPGSASSEDSTRQSSLPIPTPESNSTDSKGSAKYEFIEELLRRQDSVLQDLDDLNLRIESAIEALNAARQAEIEAEASGKNDQSQKAA